MEPTEPQLARAALTAINAFEQLPRTLPRRAALQLLGVAVENCSEQGITEGDMLEVIYRIMTERHWLNLNGSGGEP